MIIEPSSDIENKLIKHLNENGCFKFRGLFENFSKYHEYDENDIRMIFLKIDGQTYICKSKSKSLSVIKSNNIVTVSLDIIRLNKDGGYKENTYRLAGVGFDLVYRRAIVLQKK